MESAAKMERLDQIPFTYVGPDVVAALARKLDIPNPLGKDWRGLADFLDFTTDEIEHIRAQTNSGSNTEKLFKWYLSAESNSVGHVLGALQQLGREDVFNMFQQYLPRIVSKFERRSASKHGTPGQQPPIIPAYQVVPNMQSIPFPGAFPGGQIPSFGMHPAPATYYPVPNQDWDNSVPLNLSNHNSVASNSRSFNSMTPQVNRSVPYTAKVDDIEMNDMRSTSMDSTGLLGRHDPGKVSFLEGLARGQNPMASFGGVTEFGSLAVLEKPTPMLRSNSLFPTEHTANDEQEQAEIHQPLDDATRLKVENWLRTVQPDPPEPAPELLDSPVRTPGNKHKLSTSEENGGPTKKFNPARDGSSTVSYGAQGSEMWAEKWRSLEEKCISDPTTAKPTFTPSPHPAGVKRMHTWPLSKPEEKKAEKRMQQHARPTAGATQPKVTQAQHENYQQRPRSQPQVPIEPEDPNRTQNAKNPVSTVTQDDDMALIQASISKLSMSMPNGIKPASLSQGKREVRVFITYSQDNKRHMQRVINLCDCLRKNNFYPSIDIFQKVIMSQDKHGWIDKKFKEADFVFVVISPQYKHDADQSEFENGEHITYHGLHTRYIYRLMQNEYTLQACRNFRFVPLIFHASGATKEHVPDWLQNTLIYSWPNQYKDLFFHILSSSKQSGSSQKRGGPPNTRAS